MFAHQAYYGFRFLAEYRPTFWKQVVDSPSVKAIQDVGRACQQQHAMAGAGYGAAGLMTWLANRSVALRVIEAKRHRRYPKSRRPSSEQRRMAFLGVAVAAGIWKRKFSTAIRILAEAGIGIEHLVNRARPSKDVIEWMKENFFMAEPIAIYLYRLPDGRLVQTRPFPCEVPANSTKGFIIYGYGPNGPLSAYSRTLPPELIP